jgi:hypothetical protein
MLLVELHILDIYIPQACRNTLVLAYNELYRLLVIAENWLGAAHDKLNLSEEPLKSYSLFSDLLKS